jgi:chromatin segregation and condensation protein Rec8/ScpA/Scc1 (kleisin family)
MKEAAGWLSDRLARESDRFFRLGPAPLAPQPERRLGPQSPERLAEVIRLLAAEPPDVSLRHMALQFPPVAQFLERFRSLLARRRRVDFEEAVSGLSRVEVAVAFLALLDLRRSNEITIEQAAPFAPIRISATDVEGREPWIARSA